MATLTLTIKIWARLFAPDARTFRTVEWHADHVDLKGWRTELRLPFDRIADAVSVVSGLFWNRLIIKTEDRSPLVLGGLDKRESVQLAEAANEILSKHWTTQFKYVSPAIIDCAQRWIRLTNQVHYFRYSQLNAWLENADTVLHFVRHALRSKFLDRPTGVAAGIIESALEQSESKRAAYNAQFTAQQLERFERYLDRVESKPLSGPQRLACVQHDDSNLVLAGAGTGKTSTMVAKAGYLIESQEARPEEILMLAFGNKAAKEMEERVQTRLGLHSLKIKTFHSLGLEIIGVAEGRKPSLTDLAEDEKKLASYIAETIIELKRDRSFLSTFIEYFLHGLFPVKSLFDFKSMSEYVAYCKQYELRTLKGELVRSYEELSIANFLFRMGVKYQYEAPYNIDTANAERRQYRPDFYLRDHDIYLEHFGLDASGRPPAFMDQRAYLEGVRWKRELHRQHNTRLLETFSHEQKRGVLLTNLEAKLKSAGVRFNPLPDDELLNVINGIPEANDFARLLAALLKAFKLAQLKMAEFLERAKGHAEQAGMLLLMKLFQPVYERYQEHLKTSNTIDFEDMINRAIEHVRRGSYQSPYRFVLVDEFQDISEARAILIKGLLAQHAENSLFCVGDDWQAIYRFTGSDVSFTKKFSEHFGSTAVNALDTTYRFNDKIGSVASRFVQSNPDQIKKEIGSLRRVQRAAVCLIPSKSDDGGLKSALARIVQQAEFGATVLILARFNFRLPKDLKQLGAQFPRLKLQSMSVHAAKGKEADYVVVLGMESGKFGFPSEKATPPLLEILLPKKEEYPFAEERRLFYVALTRARHHVYLVSNPQNCSLFIRELRKYGQEVEQLGGTSADASTWFADNACPNCLTGYLIPRAGRYGQTFSCSNRPYCEHTERGCPRCGGLMSRSGDELVCEDITCGERLPLCPLCGGQLQERRGKWGVFWGCSNYRGDDPGSCRYTARGAEQLRPR